MKRVWFITGASRGFGVEIAKAAMRAGDCVAATGRSVAAVHAQLGADNERLLTLQGRDLASWRRDLRALATDAQMRASRSAS
jgi:NAD(P)-dependent dehydrogenase (short-subunit alcohol dehydrogenase family)